MNRYTIRVELHDATWQQYATLAQQLAARSIIDVIVADSGIRYKLPPAEYNYVGSDDIDAIMAKCKASAAATGCKFAVLVTQALLQKWEGLPQVK